MTILFKDGLSYLDLIYGVAMTQEWKVEINEGCDKSGVEQLKDSVHLFQKRIIESEWFINQLCNAATMQERQIEVLHKNIIKLSNELKLLSEAMDDRFKRIESLLEQQIP